MKRFAILLLFSALTIACGKNQSPTEMIGDALNSLLPGATEKANSTVFSWGKATFCASKATDVRCWQVDAQNQYTPIKISEEFFKVGLQNVKVTNDGTDLCGVKDGRALCFPYVLWLDRLYNVYGMRNAMGTVGPNQWNKGPFVPYGFWPAPAQNSEETTVDVRISMPPLPLFYFEFGQPGARLISSSDLYGSQTLHYVQDGKIIEERAGSSVSPSNINRIAGLGLTSSRRTLGDAPNGVEQWDYPYFRKEGRVYYYGWNAQIETLPFTEVDHFSANKVNEEYASYNHIIAHTAKGWQIVFSSTSYPSDHAKLKTGDLSFLPAGFRSVLSFSTGDTHLENRPLESLRSEALRFVFCGQMLKGEVKCFGPRLSEPLKSGWDFSKVEWVELKVPCFNGVVQKLIAKSDALCVSVEGKLGCWSYPLLENRVSYDPTLIEYGEPAPVLTYAPEELRLPF